MNSAEYMLLLGPAREVCDKVRVPREGPSQYIIQGKYRRFVEERCTGMVTPKNEISDGEYVEPFISLRFERRDDYMLFKLTFGESNGKVKG